MIDYTNRIFRFLVKALLTLLLVLIIQVHPLSSVSAETHHQTYPEYVVEYGDTLSWIALEFDTTVDEIININALTPDNVLMPGDRLKIPSLPGMQGILTNEYVTLGSSLTGISRRNQVEITDLVRVNQLTSPSELFIGRQIVTTKSEDQLSFKTISAIKPEHSFFESALTNQQNPWSLSFLNKLANPNLGLPSDTYYLPTDTESYNNIAIPGINAISIENMPFKQGETFVIKINNAAPVEVFVDIAGIQPVFTSIDESNQLALGGINALTPPGIYPLTMEFRSSEGTSYRFDQYVLINSGNYASDDVLKVDPSTIESENVNYEEAIFKALVAPITPVQLWQGLFYSPAQDRDCVISYFGSRRTYNDDPKVYYHTGLDLGYCKGTDVYAPAKGVVVGVMPDQIVRGNTLVIDHGLGVYTIYMHLASFLVNEGETVEPGQLIGIIGSTGRSTGPHLHFEVDVQGTPVNPLTWLSRTFP